MVTEFTVETMAHKYQSASGEQKNSRVVLRNMFADKKTNRNKSMYFAYFALKKSYGDNC